MPSKRDYWSKQISAWSASGTTQAAWCAKNGLAISSFSYWRRKLAAAAAATPALPATLPICISPAAPVVTADIRLPSGVSVCVPATDPVWLARLLREIGAC
ncbi:IS66 family insertion sequence element accessory protein TnpA [Stenotrophomonas sp. NPDC078853]|uniref:IS66 family insertion sequence element accessory protein TnpA n=1 Tax=Stenotrophomonas sp. NPDC078853 TaxID=3364534 RepID=UPI00384E07BA